MTQISDDDIIYKLLMEWAWSSDQTRLSDESIFWLMRLGRKLLMGLIIIINTTAPSTKADDDDAVKLMIILQMLLMTVIYLNFLMMVMMILNQCY